MTIKFELTIEQLWFFFRSGMDQGSDNATCYDWGTINHTKDSMAFEDALIEMVVKQSDYDTWEEYYQAKCELKEKLDKAYPDLIL